MTTREDIEAAEGSSDGRAGLARRVVAGVQELYRRPSSAIGATIFVVFLLMAIFGPLIAPYGPNEQVVEDAREPPSADHWFGTDNLGRDIFSRVILGARDVLALAGLGTLAAVILGTTIGLVSGYYGGWLDEVLMRFFDSLLSLPALLLALLLLGSLGPSRNSVLIVITVVYTPIVARVVRSVVLSVKTKEFVEAARVQGEPVWYILSREIFPSTLPALAVEASLRFSYAIFLVASLGFLGVGVQPPSPDWGLMVKEGRANFTQTPWALYFPAGAIAVVVIGVNLVADTLKQILQVPSQLRR
jgi:peptide/nickel transport system permease protein